MGHAEKTAHGMPISVSNEKSTATNREALRPYEARVQEYSDGTAQTLTGAAKDWIDAALVGLPPGAKVVELGSAFGRDAAYVASKGFEVECTDAVAGFVVRLRAEGFEARPRSGRVGGLPGVGLLAFGADDLVHGRSSYRLSACICGAA